MESARTDSEYDLIVAGAGPAGSACAITAARAGARVLLLDKDRFPRHKVCGEFVSSESLQLLESLLEQDPFRGQPEIHSSRVFIDKRSILFPVAPAARSIPRYDLDSALLQAARCSGIRVEESMAVHSVERQPAPQDKTFAVCTAKQTFTAKAVVNATGRWSHLTQFQINGHTRWIGVKAHFSERDAPNSVDLYFFPGGYCGVVPVGEGAINACAMVQAAVAKSLEEVFACHHELERRSRHWRPLFPAVTTSPLYFRKPVTSNQDMMLVGDSAGFIDPFVGDGISLALQSGALAAESITGFLRAQCSLEEAQQQYQSAYSARLAPALRNSARLRLLLATPAWLRSTLLALAGTRPMAQLIVGSTRAR